MRAEEIVKSAFWKSEESHTLGDFSGNFPALNFLGGSVCFQTSGSMGEPKWIVHGKNALLHSAKAVNEELQVTPNSIWGLALPLHHVGGFGVLARAYEVSCAYAVFQERWDPKRFTQWLDKNALTHVSLVPTQVYDLVNEKLQAPASLIALVVGGGKLSGRLGQEARNLGWPVLASYGMTEAASMIAVQKMSRLHEAYLDSPLETLPIWEVEESRDHLLRLRGDALFAGTIEKGVFVSRKEDWFTTSDRVSLLGKRIFPLGRADSLVKIMGELVDTEKVRKRFLDMTQACDAELRFAVVSLPDARRENALFAVFEGSERDFEKDLALYQSMAAGLERFEKALVVPSFPRTELGKIRYGELQKICFDLRGESA